MMFYVTTHLVIDPHGESGEEWYTMEYVQDAVRAIRDDHEVVYVQDAKVAKAVLKAGGTSERDANRRVHFALTGELKED